MTPTIRRALRWILALMAVVLVGIQFVRPARTNPAGPPSQDIAARLTIPSNVQGVLDRSCRDCHSNATQWPWYSNVAPISWFVIDHVDHGRSHLNFSEWGSYAPNRAASLLDGACELAREGQMPLRSYLLMHRNARLSAQDIETLCAWTSAARASAAPAVSQ